jgi:AraC family transcriptional regulator, transcriptional activator of pobA
MKCRKRVLHFDDINSSHEFIGFTGRTDIPGFHVYTIEETYPFTRQVMPPYTFRFLLCQSGSATRQVYLFPPRSGML